MNYLQIKLENDRIFREGSFPEMRSEYVAEVTPVPAPRSGPFRVQEHLLRTDTISAVLQFPGKHVCALNFANANFPGGAYVLGGNAQEEALCRASLLYYTIRTAKSYYIRNHLHILPDYTDGMIWSENVPVIRDNQGNRLETPVNCDFITCPAVNRTFAKFLMPRRKLDSVMERRITGIIGLAAQKKPDVLILGAFGCGVFGNRRETVYPMFEQAIGQYLSDAIEVVFADPR
jgi:uncharacterized protein (TIGR02452 family)